MFSCVRSFKIQVWHLNSVQALYLNSSLTFFFICNTKKWQATLLWAAFLKWMNITLAEYIQGMLALVFFVFRPLKNTLWKNSMFTWNLHCVQREEPSQKLTKSFPPVKGTTAGGWCSIQVLDKIKCLWQHKAWKVLLLQPHSLSWMINTQKAIFDLSPCRG